ncbi:MAG: tRNA pseudouridine(55) synthase TruB [Chloroflexaceae bacterium]|nr:tRNA pseudouridine(55) synthase TruB [Chloroflexaceae bacterium]
MPLMHGFLNVNKPAGMTSHAVVARIRRVVGRSVKVGHAGTLDPAAMGVLPVALGQATRLIAYLADTRKGYRAAVCLGKTTTTDDAEGDVLEERPVPPLDHEALEAVLGRFRGEIMQVPPIYSALHHEGQRLYDLARRGQAVVLAPRPVTLYRLELERDPDPALAHSVVPHLLLTVECSKGTYIRALARDIGEVLDCGGYLASLERTMVGPFTLDRAIPLAALLEQDDPAWLAQALLPPETAVLDWPAVMLTPDRAGRIRNGQAIVLEAGEVGPGADAVRSHAPGGKLLALLRRRDQEWHPEKVLNL